MGASGSCRRGLHCRMIAPATKTMSGFKNVFQNKFFFQSRIQEKKGTDLFSSKNGKNRRTKRLSGRREAGGGASRQSPWPPPLTGNQGTSYQFFFLGLPPFPGTKILSSLLSSRLIRRCPADDCLAG